jgi:hypothetical protein
LRRRLVEDLGQQASGGGDTLSRRHVPAMQPVLDARQPPAVTVAREDWLRAFRMIRSSP